MATCAATRPGSSAGATLPRKAPADVFRIGGKVDPRAGDEKAAIGPVVKRQTFDSLMEGYDGPAPACIDAGKTCGKEIW